MKRKSKPQVRFGTALRKCRKARGLSQEGLADISGLHFTYVGSVERGERNISINAIDRLLKALALTYSEFFASF
ncbi:MAG TPA: helix-turn-helix transcriptional regulator [Terriglobia bacterium]|nr:helix-turn-helix transcriptional regulator [Terriglobia bacterium]